MNLRIRYYQDPGHGWIAVKRVWLNMLGIENKITGYSYQRGSTVYLEEDCDMTTFHQAAKAAGWDINYLVVHYSTRHPIRSYQRFT